MITNILAIIGFVTISKKVINKAINYGMELGKQAVDKKKENK